MLDAERRPGSRSVSLDAGDLRSAVRSLEEKERVTSLSDEQRLLLDGELHVMNSQSCE